MVLLLQFDIASQFERKHSKGLERRIQAGTEEETKRG